MKVAALSDIHANLHALEAVLPETDDADVVLRTTDYDTTGASAEMRTSGHPDSLFADEPIEPCPLERLIPWFEGRA